MTATTSSKKAPPEIFKAYDIRGIVGRTLTVEVTESGLIEDGWTGPHGWNL